MDIVWEGKEEKTNNEEGYILSPIYILLVQPVHACMHAVVGVNPNVVIWLGIAMLEIFLQIVTNVVRLNLPVAISLYLAFFDDFLYIYLKLISHRARTIRTVCRDVTCWKTLLHDEGKELYTYTIDRLIFADFLTVPTGNRILYL